MTAIQELRDNFRRAFHVALTSPTVQTIGSAGVWLREYWFEAEMAITREDLLVEITNAFVEYGDWFEHYRTPPMSRKVSYSNRTLEVECTSRLEEIYRKINLALQKIHFFYKISEAKHDLETRLELIDTNIYGARRRGKVPKVADKQHKPEREHYKNLPPGDETVL